MQHDSFLWYLCPPSVHPETQMSTPKWTNHNYCPGTFSTPCPLWYRVPKTSTIRRFHVDKKCPFRSGHLCFLGGHPVDKCTIELHHAASSSQTHDDETFLKKGYADLAAQCTPRCSRPKCPFVPNENGHFLSTPEWTPFGTPFGKLLGFRALSPLVPPCSDSER